MKNGMKNEWVHIDGRYMYCERCKIKKKCVERKEGEQCCECGEAPDIPIKMDIESFKKNVDAFVQRHKKCTANDLVKRELGLGTVVERLREDGTYIAQCRCGGICISADEELIRIFKKNHTESGAKRACCVKKDQYVEDIWGVNGEIWQTT